MTTKYLADSLQEEAEKSISPQGEYLRQVSSQEILAPDGDAVEPSATVAELATSESNVNAVVRELQQVITMAKQKEATLISQVSELQTALSVERASVERSQKELDEAKQMILQLAESNSQLIAEKEGFKPARDSSKLIHHKKSHLLTQKLTNHPKASDDFAANAWLYD
jgi:Asp-tRNA(Asn)/Glu-tRNA(Gln) amidotransferase C subunit